MTFSFFTTFSPVSDINSDSLGRTHFVENLQQLIISIPPDEGLVIALNGPWGAGKTTVLKFLEQSFHNLPISERPTVVWLNPWQKAGQDKPLGQLFVHEILNQLSVKDDHKALEAFQKIAEFAAVVSPEFKNPFDIARKLFPSKPKDLYKQRSEAEANLRNRKTKVVFFIEDIDRLLPTDCLEILRASHIMLGFPNVVCILSLDIPSTVKSINNAMGIETSLHGPPVGLNNLGSTFLEKLINISFDLPAVEGFKSIDFSWNAITHIVDSVPLKDRSWNEKEFIDNFYHPVRSILDTPRRWITLANTSTVTLQMVSTEVDCGDFIALETLRLFAPDVYAHVRKYSQWFSGEPVLLDDKHFARAFLDAPIPSKDLVDAFHKAWFKTRFDDKTNDPNVQILSGLFPRFAHSIGLAPKSTKIVSDEMRRARAESAFPAYITLSLPTRLITNKEVLSVLEMVEEANKLKIEFDKLVSQTLATGRSKLSSLLEKMKDYSYAISETKARSFIDFLIQHGANYDREEDKEEHIGGDRTNSSRAAHAILNLLRKLQEQERFPLMERHWAQPEVAPLLPFVTFLIGLYHGMPSGRIPIGMEPIFTQREVKAIVKVAVERLTKKTAFKKMITFEPLHYVFEMIQWVKKRGGATEWLFVQLNDSESMSLFLQCWYARRRSLGMFAWTKNQINEFKTLLDKMEQSDKKQSAEELTFALRECDEMFQYARKEEEEEEEDQDGDES